MAEWQERGYIQEREKEELRDLILNDPEIREMVRGTLLDIN